MSFGKMNQLIDIISTVPVKDADGFITRGDAVIASVRAYKEDRHGSEKWASRAVFSTATALFRIRKIPQVEITTENIIICSDERYNIISIEDVKGKGMYLEILAEKVMESG